MSEILGKRGYAVFISVDSGTTYARLFLGQNFNVETTADTEEVTDIALPDADWESPDLTKKRISLSAEGILAKDQANNEIGYYDFMGYLQNDTEVDVMIAETKSTGGEGIDSVIAPVEATDIDTGKTTKQITFKAVVPSVTQGATAGENATFNVTLQGKGAPTITSIAGTGV